MERKESNSGILDLMIQPAFTVKDGVVDQVNEAAKQYFVESGAAIADLLLTGKAEYAELEEGCLYLTLTVAGLPCGASVRRMEGYDVFTIEQEADQSELQAMALAAQELRIPLSNVMTVADQLFPVADDNEDAASKTQVSQINRGLFQMLRIISNMADAYRYSQQTEAQKTVTNITALYEEIFRKSGELLNQAGVQLHFENLKQDVFSLADEEKLERAVHNMISNAVKFSQKGSAIHAQLSRKNNMLLLTIQDSGNGMADEIRGNVHTRFRRQPGLEDSRFGIGLGMVMIRSAAAAHGGAVLIDHPEGCGTRITMSLPICQPTDRVVHASMLQIDYAGERDHALIELSEVLPSAAYVAKKIN